MSVSNVSQAHALGSMQQSLKASVSGASNSAGSFADVLNNVRQTGLENATGIQSTHQGLGANSLLNGNANFASVLNQAQTESNATSAFSAVNGNFGLADLYMYNSLQTASTQNINAVSSVDLNSDAAALSESSEQNVNLKDFSLDFTALLPQGIKSFIKDLKCSQAEMNNFVNVMVFGTEQGPQGQNAASFFGKDDMTHEELAASVQDILSNARINTWDVTGQDLDFVLSNQGSAAGQTLAAERGLSLEQRAIERDLDSTYEKDMALMQILSRTNNQSANIF